jgi:hypothetical protein
MHWLLACLCNSRIVQPAHAGEGPSWPLLLLWGGLLAVAAAGALFWLVRRRGRPSTGGAPVDGYRRPTGTFIPWPGAGVSDDPVGGSPSSMAAEAGPARVARTRSDRQPAETGVED